jgi:DNA topoisomerase-3
LYEEGYLTYPRTNSEYLATNEKGKIKSIISNVSKLGYDISFKDKKTIFDDSKIESHSALTPTYKIPNKNNLSEDEYVVYATVLKRFAAVFCTEECRIEKSEIKVKLANEEEFALKGNVIVEKGWTKYDEYNKNDKLLPNLNKGDEFQVNFEVKEKKTTPPKHYTIETLKNYLKNPFKEDKKSLEENEEDDSEEYRAILDGLELGTEATRTGIIDNAIKSGYIELKKDVYYLMDGGEYLINALAKMNISMDKYKTSELGKALKKVFKGENNIESAVELVKEEISLVFNENETSLEKETDTGYFGEVVGACPICGCKVVKDRYGYGCSGYKEGCKFRISDYICSRVISKNNVIKLLQEGRTSKIEGFTSKNGKKFDAYLVLENGKIGFKF